ncbi:restriction endonuclease subunit S [Nocardia cyriacigeorgica]|uniref:restriction endonuclease subunit S n=1 Tax=Nocardia cyriacigeorgica TaxID=135487 RepID=UPI0018940BA9|nr:restriction endonuclease subunit S [Nocardia cyriacigeorgica]MBF6088903.1 restriction endonuclease subunit S [Nocardia cyriacigeorgica]
MTNWGGLRARFCFGVRDIRGVDAPLASATKDGVFLREDLDFSVWNPSSNISNYKLVEPDDFVIGLRSFQHGISHSTVRGIVSPAYTVLRASGRGIEPRYYKYYFRSSLLISHLTNLTQGIRQGQAIDIEAFRNLMLPVPPLEEQRRIADFLDAETSRIDTLIRLQRQVLEKLDNRIGVQRDIEISRLAKLGKLVPLRRFVWSVDQGSSPQCDAIPAGDGEWGVLKVSCLRPGVFIPAENKRLPDGIRPNRVSEVRRGDLLITRANTPQLVGATAVVGEVRPMLLLPDKIFRVRLSEKVLPEFIAEVAAGTNIRALCAATSNGASQSMANIRFEEVKAWPIPLVPLPDQRTFVAAMQDARSNIASLADSIRRQLKLLAERRQALITAAVTGQFDVSTASGRNATQGV